MNYTVLQIVKASPPFNQSAGVGIFGSPLGIMDVEISDMTLDCNLSRQPKAGDGPALLAATGVGFSLGSRVRLKRVRIINWGTHTPLYVNGEQQPDSKTKECFPVFIVSQGGGALGEAVLEDCIIEQPDLCQGRECSLLLSRANTNSPQFFSTIRNNYLNGDYTTGSAPPPIEVTGISVITTGSGDLVQFVTKWPHRVQGGDEVYIAGATSNPSYNGRHVVEGAPNTDEFRTFCIKKGSLGSIPTDAGITIQRYVPRAMPVYLTAAKALVSGSWVVTVTITTPVPHLRRSNPGDYVRISGVTVGADANNLYNGAFKVSAVTSNTIQYQFTVATEPALPDGSKEVWLDRWPSARVVITGMTRSLGLYAYAEIQTGSPHFRVPGDYVLVVGVTVGSAGGPASAVMNGYFKVEDWPGQTNRKFKVRESGALGICRS